MNYGNGMCVDTGIKFCEFQSLKTLPGKFHVILLVLLLGCLCTQEINLL